MNNQKAGTARRLPDTHILTIIGLMALVLIMMLFLQPGNYFSLKNARSMIYQFPEYGILAFGMMVCMIAGGIDLSLVGIMNFTGVIAALIVKHMVPAEGGPMTALVIILAVAAAIVIGCACGAFNGFIIGYFHIPAMLVTLCGIGMSIMSRGEKHHIKLDIPFKGILLGIGAGTGQGVGLVLSKIGMEHYGAAVPAGAAGAMEAMLPFASTLIRAIVGAIGFIILLGLGKGLGSLKAAVKDPKGMKYATLLTIFGPALGVSLSLMAVRYANAGIASTLMALTPVLIIAPDVLVNKHKIKIKEILGVLVSVAGVAMFFLL